MLVHTAVPERCKNYQDYEVKFTIVGGSSTDRKRKINNEYTLDELTLPVPKRVSTPSPSLLHTTTSDVKPLRASGRNCYLPSTSASSAMVSMNTSKSPEQTLRIQRRSVNSGISSKSPVYEEIVCRAPKKYSLIVVKPPKPDPKAVILNKLAPTPVSDEDIAEDQPVYSIEDENISSTQAVEDKPEEPEKGAEMEKYSEFIFNGEIFVQMPKRVFEEEKNRIRKECETYKLLLRKLKSHLAKMPDLD